MTQPLYTSHVTSNLHPTSPTLPVLGYSTDQILEYSLWSTPALPEEFTRIIKGSFAVSRKWDSVPLGQELGGGTISVPYK